MKRSSAKFIPYNLRPAKQIERRILLDFLSCVCDPNQPSAALRYVGMGGTMFYDFLLVHRFLGIKNMISLERDEEIFPRSTFNAPYDFIKVINESVGNFLASDTDETTTIYWLDYDDGLGPGMAGDIVALGTRLKLGGCAFVTAYADPPGILNREKADTRLAYFEENFPDFAAQFDRDDMQNANFPMTVYKVLMAAFKNAFAHRKDGNFYPLFRIRYKDSSAMVTVGGIFCSEERSKICQSSLRGDLPFLFKKDPFTIRRLNLTDKERLLFDVAATKPKRTSSQAYQLRRLGFEASDIDAYQGLIRFLPRYHESII